MKALVYLENSLTKKTVFIGLATFGLVFIFGASVLSFLDRMQPIGETSSPSEEIQQIIAVSDVSERAQWYKKLIERVGPNKAQEELLHSGLPFTGETHLLNHTVGEYLYEQYGPAGLVYCKDYFLASCYHGFFIETTSFGGIGTIKPVMEECAKVGNVIVIQCAHAVGHGLLAWTGYASLIDALKLCDNVGETDNDFPLFNCYDGVFMENIWAIHDGGTLSPDRWVDPTDPVYPCSDSRIDEKYLNACWSNQPSLMYQLFHRDIKKVGEECLKIDNPTHQKTCFNGLARQIHPITYGGLSKTFEMCDLMPSTWIDYCVITVAGSGLGVGDRKVPFQICAKIEKDESREECWRRLSGVIAAYGATQKERHEWCDKIQDNSWRKKCEAAN